MSTLIVHNDAYTITACYDGPADIEPDAVEEIVYYTMKFTERLGLEGHFLVTIVAGDAIDVGDDEDLCFSAYLQGIHHILIAGAQPESWDGTREEFLEDLRLSLAHEMIHYQQDLNGNMSEDGVEEAAIELSRSEGTAAP